MCVKGPILLDAKVYTTSTLLLMSSRTCLEQSGAHNKYFYFTPQVFTAYVPIWRSLEHTTSTFRPIAIIRLHYWFSYRHFKHVKFTGKKHTQQQLYHFHLILLDLTLTFFLQNKLFKLFISLEANTISCSWYNNQHQGKQTKATQRNVSVYKKKLKQRNLPRCLLPQG